MPAPGPDRSSKYPKELLRVLSASRTTSVDNARDTQKRLRLDPILPYKRGLVTTRGVEGNVKIMEPKAVAVLSIGQRELKRINSVQPVESSQVEVSL